MQYLTLPTCSTKQKCSPFYFKWSKYISLCMHVTYLSIYLPRNQPSATISGHPLNVSKGTCFSNSQQATWCWTQGSVMENLWLLSYAEQDLPRLSGVSGPISIPSVFQNCQKWERDAGMCVFFSHFLFLSLQSWWIKAHK